MGAMAIILSGVGKTGPTRWVVWHPIDNSTLGASSVKSFKIILQKRADGVSPIYGESGSEAFVFAYLYR